MVCIYAYTQYTSKSTMLTYEIYIRQRVHMYVIYICWLWKRWEDRSMKDGMQAGQLRSVDKEEQIISLKEKV